MRARIPIELVVSAATLLVACNSTTGPELPPPDDTGMISVLTVAPSTATIDGGRFVKLTARVIGQAGVGAAPPAVTWFSSDTNVATVHADGLVEGRKAGRVQVVATWQAARGSALVTVLNPVRKKPSIPCQEPVPTAESDEMKLISGGKC
jgi:hypothetical protein